MKENTPIAKVFSDKLNKVEIVNSDLLEACKDLCTIAENLLEWCIEPDKKLIYKGYIEKHKRAIHKAESEV